MSIFIRLIKKTQSQTRLETIATTTINAINEAHKLCRRISMVILSLAISYKSNNRNIIKNCTGGLNVPDATSHLGLKIRKSANGTPGCLDFAVRTQNIEGSM